MLPTLTPGTLVLAIHRTAYIDDIVIAVQGGREVIKRLTSKPAGRYYLLGDNALESTDSREFGPVKEEAIKGVVVKVFPIAEPTVFTARARVVARGLGLIILLMAVTQLVRFDTFVPIFYEPFAISGALIVAGILVAAEVFALPFLLGMALSPLARFMSMAAGWLVAMGWLVVGVFTLTARETGHLGSLVALNPGVWAIIFALGLLGSMVYLTFTWRSASSLHKQRQ